MMGESGPEAIMPLKRTSSGDLGVKAESSGVVNNFYIDTMDAKSFSDFADKNSSIFAGQVIRNIQRGNKSLMKAIKTVK